MVPSVIIKFDLYLNESQSFPELYLGCSKDQDNAPHVAIKGMFSVLSILLLSDCIELFQQFTSFNSNVDSKG